MTNHQSVATVTAILSQVVQGFAVRAIEGAGVSMQRPDSAPPPGSDGDTNRVNLFMFQVNFDPNFRNADLPTRDRVGQVVQRPRAALQLHYLLTFYGDESVLAPQRMLAAVVAGLHARPWISMERAAAFIADNQDSAASFNYLADSQLADQGESVRLIPDSLNLEELSKLWSVFFQVPYALSIAYKAAVILVDTEESPRSPLPVRMPVIKVRPDHGPIVLTTVQPQGARAGAPIFSDTTLAVTGSGFSGADLVVRIDGVSTPVSPTSSSSLVVDLTGRALRAGSHVLQVARAGGAGSNPYGFALRPRLTAVVVVDVTVGATTQRAIRADTDVTVGAGQRVELLLEDLGSARGAYTLAAPRREADGTRVQVLRGGVPDGTFLLRLRIDGAESELETSGVPPDESYTGPSLVLP